MLVCRPPPGVGSYGVPSPSVTKAVLPSVSIAWSATWWAVATAVVRHGPGSTGSQPSSAAPATAEASHTHRPCDQVYLSSLTSCCPRLSQQVRTPPRSGSGPWANHHGRMSLTRWSRYRCAMPPSSRAHDCTSRPALPATGGSGPAVAELGVHQPQCVLDGLPGRHLVLPGVGHPDPDGGPGHRHQQGGAQVVVDVHAEPFGQRLGHPALDGGGH